ncbi:MAG TPA: hypothetical protein VGB15_00975 [Longimicrobium sp.]
MDPKEAVLMGVAAIVVCMPVLAVTARLTLKPVVDAIVRLRELVPPSTDAGAERRMVRLEDEVRQLRGTVAGLEATVEFQQKLLASAVEMPTLGAGREPAGVA